MHDDADDGLFADPRPAPPQVAVPDPDEVPDWLVANLRRALDDVGLESMAERQALIVELAGRPVASLRELTFVEARQVAEKLTARRKAQPGAAGSSARSSWDDREGDTWIDRM
ncbi:hypothetical protein ACJ5H2_00100 [Nocardioides sp. R1-1]|uniref:hypothetical protein n=1 Tax=Nocardioides sp. R1-1 TaxID=3383502 RepID=UPI0038D18933